ncbi:protein of unknown function [Rhodovastum atsumiense]|nr:protein of unknown function [Rhodovastum atsumiense]
MGSRRWYSRCRWCTTGCRACRPAGSTARSSPGTATWISARISGASPSIAACARPCCCMRRSTRAPSPAARRWPRPPGRRQPREQRCCGRTVPPGRSFRTVPSRRPRPPGRPTRDRPGRHCRPFPRRSKSVAAHNLSLDMTTVGSAKLSPGTGVFPRRCA